MTIIVWEMTTPGETPEASDAILEKLGSAWRKVGDESFIFRRYWTWEEMTGMRRREYGRVGGG